MAAADNNVVTVMGVGDVSPQRDDPPSLFRHCKHVLHTADIMFGQMENAMSDRGAPQFLPYSPSKLAPKNVTALTAEGAAFDVMSFACNHAMDYGADAFCDTIDSLAKHNIAVVGAGRNIDEARKPVIFEKKGNKIGFLAYLSVATPGLIAQDEMPGCAPLMASTAYQPVHFSPGFPPKIITQLFPDQKKAMEEDIRRLRPQVDVLIVSMHAGVIGIPAHVAMYQKEAAYAAVDAGADLILQHHAHILRGIEVYKGKAIFYGLCNFGIQHRMHFKGRIKNRDPSYAMPTTILKINHLVGPGWENYPYHPDARMTMIAKAYIQDKKIQKVSYIPAIINQQAEPEIATKADGRGQKVFDYVQEISEAEDLKVKFAWEGDEVVVGSVA